MGAGDSPGPSSQPPSDERETMTATLQSYTTGTVSVTNGSDIVTLTGGTWLESWCVPGSDMRIAGESTAMVIEEWIDTTHVRLTIPIQRATAAGLVYSILMTSPAFGTNRLGALTAVERIRLMTENSVISQLLGIAVGDLAVPTLQDRIGIWDASDDMNAKPGTLQAALKAGTGVLARAASYAVTVDDYGSLITMSAGTGARTVTLPAAATAGAGFVIGVKKIDASANAVTIAASGADTIDGAASLALTVQYGTAILRCDGTVWHVVVLENTSGAGRTLLGKSDAAAMLTYLGAQPLDSDLAAIAALATSANKLLGTDGAGNYSLLSSALAYAALGEIPNGQLPSRLQMSPAQPAGGDYNNLTDAGFGAGAGSASVHGPPENGGFGPIIIGRNAGTNVQLAGFGDAGRPFKLFGRGLSDAAAPNGGWSTWETFLRLSDIERGSNANGEYVRFPDGTQICFVQLTVNLNSNAFQAKSLPAPFLSGSLVTGAVSFGDTQTSGSSADWWNSTGSIGVYVSTTVAKLLYRGTLTATTGPCFIAVSGKYK